jgi:hypothetical protein
MGLPPILMPTGNNDAISTKDGMIPVQKEIMTMKLKRWVYILNNLVCVLLILLCAQIAESSSWQIMPGRARDIGIGANGSVWVIGSTQTEGGYGIYRWTGTNWSQVDGAAVVIDVDDGGTPWIANSGGAIYRREGDRWQIKTGKARDIGIGRQGDVWVIGWTRIAGGGYGIYKWIGSRWQQVDGAAVAIDVDASGTPWVVNSEGSIYRRAGNRWQILPGKARDIGIGYDGSVWVIGWTRIGSGGYGIYKWTGSNWRQIDGEAVRISVDPSGRPWVVNSAGNIYKHK